MTSRWALCRPQGKLCCFWAEFQAETKHRALLDVHQGLLGLQRCRTCERTACTSVYVDGIISSFGISFVCRLWMLSGSNLVALV